MVERDRGSSMWTCPRCDRRFGRANQGHECAPAMSIDEYFQSGPDFEPAIFAAIRDHMQSLDPDIWFEPVSVGIFFKRRSSFLQLRTMTKWVAVAFNLDRKLEHGRLSRKVVSHGRRFYHVVNVRDASEIDDLLLGWLTEAWECDA